MSCEQSYTASRESVKKATELFQSLKKSKKRRRGQKEEEEDVTNKYSQMCSPIITNVKKRTTASSFLPGFALMEMRSCLMKHDWVNLLRLFPLLLELPSDKETLVWRYALTILLHSPLSSSDHVEDFLNSCVGCQNDNLNYVLQQLITLRSMENKR